MNLWAWREKADLFHRAWTMPEELTLGPTHYSIHTMSQDGKTIFVIGIHKHGELMRYDARAEGFLALRIGALRGGGQLLAMAPGWPMSRFRRANCGGAGLTAASHCN